MGTVWMKQIFGPQRERKGEFSDSLPPLLYAAFTHAKVLSIFPNPVQFSRCSCQAHCQCSFALLWALAAPCLTSHSGQPVPTHVSLPQFLGFRGNSPTLLIYLDPRDTQRGGSWCQRSHLMRQPHLTNNQTCKVISPNSLKTHKFFIMPFHIPIFPLKCLDCSRP